MNRTSFIRFGAAAAILTLTTAGIARAQGQQDFSNVQVKTTKIAGNFYTLEGQGGMIGVLAGPDGVFMVDSQFGPLTEKIVAAIKQINPGPIRFMVNTHVHPDHTGGNENLGKLGVAILSRDQLRARLAGGQRPSPAAALPVLTYDQPITIHMNGEGVKLIPIRAAHTDGDTLVHFPAADVLMTGDFYRAIGFPYPDRANGGTLAGLIAGLNQVIEVASPTTKIVPGHGPIVTEKEVTEHRDMAIAVRDKIAAMVKEGKTADQIVAAKPTADYDKKFEVPTGNPSAERFVRAVVTELTAR
jgi:glyoxylase-like metal-dependent hydrolase (beta-lactamase superfamily II)